MFASRLTTLLFACFKLAVDATADGPRLGQWDRVEHAFQRWARRFFGTMATDSHKQIGQGGKREMMMETLPRATLVVI
jgi:hypothetical protein